MKKLIVLILPLSLISFSVFGVEWSISEAKAHLDRLESLLQNNKMKEAYDVQSIITNSVMGSSFPTEIKERFYQLRDRYRQQHRVPILLRRIRENLQGKGAEKAMEGLSSLSNLKSRNPQVLDFFSDQIRTLQKELEEEIEKDAYGSS